MYSDYVSIIDYGLLIIYMLNIWSFYLLKQFCDFCDVRFVRDVRVNRINGIGFGLQ